MDGIISDKIWHCVFVQCPKCESGIHLLESDSRFEYYIESDVRLIEYRSKICSCGHLLLSEEINKQIKSGYSMPSFSWVCPKCSVFQSSLSHFEGFYQKKEDEWKDAGLSTNIETYHMPKELHCKGCNERWKKIVLLSEDRTQVIIGLGKG